MREPEDERQQIATGQRVRELRQARGITTEKLSEGAGISVQYLNALERGKKCMSFVILSKIARTLGCSCDYLVSGKEALSPLCDVAARTLAELRPIDRELVADLLLKAYDTVRELGRE